MIYLKEKKSINGRREKKNVATVATVPLATVVTFQNLKKKDKVANQNGTVDE